VTYKDGVYDITDFVDGHPGGSARIMMAAGVPCSPPVGFGLWISSSWCFARHGHGGKTCGAVAAAQQDRRRSSAL